MKSFKAIAAMSLNRVIGCHNTIPWRLPEDLRWFKKLTMGHTIVMGRRTFESIGKPLPGRATIVVSRVGIEIPGVKVINDLRDLHRENGDVFICGGADIYAQMLPQCSELYLTLVKREVEGDAFFPPFEHLFEPAELIQDTAEFSITRFHNIKLPDC